MEQKILLIKSSPRGNESYSARLSYALIDHLKMGGTTTVIERDISGGLPFVDAEMIQAYFTPDADKTEALKKATSFSDELVQELFDHDVYVLATPIWNFSVPAVLKAYVDLVSRAGKTFKFEGPGQSVGLLQNKKAYIVVASGGIPIGSAYDIATSYLKSVVGFLGITDVTVVGADGLNIPAMAVSKLEAAEDYIKTLQVA